FSRALSRPCLPCSPAAWSARSRPVFLSSLLLCREDSGSAPAPAAAPPVEDEDEALPPAAALPEPVCEDWLVCAPCPIDEVEPTSVEDWLADTLELVELLPLPMFTPGLTFAPALMSVLLTPTFGLTLTLREVPPEAALGELVLDDW